MTELATEPKPGGPAAPDSDSDAPDTIDIRVTLPVQLVVDLKHRTGGRLDVAETVALIVQLYAAAPLSRGGVTLTVEQHAKVCETLGFTPRTVDELVGAIESLVAVSFGGVRVKFTAEEVELINARNATDMAPKEWAASIMRAGFEAWRDGRI